MSNIKQKRRRLYAVLICLILCSVCVLILGAILHNFVFLTEKINVEGNTRYSADDIIAASEIELSSPIYSVNKADVKNRIMLAYPYIEKVVVKRDLPSDLTIIVTESDPLCVSKIHGEYFVLSDELRVLEYSKEKHSEDSLIELVLPTVKRAMLGEAIELFVESEDKYITDALEKIKNSTIFEKIKLVCVESKFDIYAIYEDMYRIEFGSVKDMDVKLEVAAAVINSDKLENGIKAVIDVTDPKEATVISNRDMELSFLDEK